jgi:G protein pathway suppressor 2
MTLEETKESIAKQTQQLEVLKNKKHDLFQQLKKVLNNEDKRKERHDQHPTYMKEKLVQSTLIKLTESRD